MAQKFRVTDSQKRALAIATVLALIFGAYFLRHYVTLIIFAAIMAFIFTPIYKRRIARGNKPGTAAAITLLIACVVVIIPLILILTLTAFQINHVVRTVGSQVNSVTITNITHHTFDNTNHILAKTPITFRLTPDWVHDSAIHLVQKAGSATLSNLSSYAGNFFSFFTTAVIFIFVFLSLLKNRVKLGQIIRKLNPLGDDINDLYFARVNAMTKAMIRGQFIIALLQGLVDAVLIYAGGFHEAFFFLFIVLTALSFIPLGGGILAIPIGIVMLLTGNIIGGIVVIAGHILIVTNVDNFLRPRLVPQEAKLDSALTILSVFAGISLLGFLGIIVGPVIMIVLVTTITTYLKVFQNYDMSGDDTVATAKIPHANPKPPRK